MRINTWVSTNPSPGWISAGSIAPTFREHTVKLYQVDYRLQQ